MPCNDCSRTETCPPCPYEEPLCRCGHPEERHTTSLPEEGREDYCTECDGPDEKHAFVEEPSTECEGGCRIYTEPPLTPEEEEMVSGYEELAEQAAGLPLASEKEEELAPEPSCCGNPNCTCGGSCDCDNEASEDTPCSEVEGCDGNCCAKAPPPPQPDRRPPYLLAYSVQGHLYEVALPGDATVAALDGRLVITHQLGPVAGICQIAPITSEESA